MLAKASQPSPPCYAGARERYGRNVSMSPDYHLSPRKRSANCHIHVAGRRVRADLLPPLAGGESASADSGGWVSYVASRPPPRIRKERILSPAVLGTEASHHPESAKRILTSPGGRGNAARRARTPSLAALHARVRVRKNGEKNRSFSFQASRSQKRRVLPFSASFGQSERKPAWAGQRFKNP